MADTVRHLNPAFSIERTCLLAAHASGTSTSLLPGFGSCIEYHDSNKIAVQADLPERKPRKSVAFSEGTTIVDSNGDVTESIEVNGGKSSAESHSAGPPTPPGEDTHTHDTRSQLTSGLVAEDKDVEEVTDMFADLAKKVRYHTQARI